MKRILTWLKQQPLSHLLFYLFIFCIPFQTRIIFNSDQAYIGSLFSYHKAIFFYATDILFILFYASHIFFDKSPKKTKFWLILAIVAGLVSMFHVEQWGLYWFYLVKLIQFWLIVDYVRISGTGVFPVLVTLAFSGVFQSVLAILQFHMQQGLNIQVLGEYVPKSTDLGAATLKVNGEQVLRSYGTFPHPNLLGGFLALILIALVWVSRGTKAKMAFYSQFIAFIPIIWGLILSFSRSAWLAAIMGLIIFFCYQIIDKRYKLALIWAIFLIVSCGTFAISYNEYIFPRIADTTINSDAASYRSTFNDQGLALWRQHPLTGIGLGQYVPKHESLFHVEQWQHQPPHNIFIFLLAQFGVIGLVLSLLAYFNLGFTWNIIKNGLSLSFLISILVLAMFDHYLISIQQGLLIFALFCGLIIKKDVSQHVKHL